MRREQPQIDNGAFLSIFLAGPLFMMLCYPMHMLSMIPQAIELQPGLVVVFLTTMVLATVFGPFVAIVPTMLGVHGMAWLGTVAPSTRSAAVWTVTGGAIVALPLWLSGGFEPDGFPPIASALVLTAGVCAFSGYRNTRWVASAQSESELTTPVVISTCPAK